MPDDQKPVCLTTIHPCVVTSIDELLCRTRARLESNRRWIIGITGAPGAGKSTLAQALIDDLGPQIAVDVPMDGFHLANAVLDDLGIHDRKGAPHTFDSFGYVAMMRRIREQPDAAAQGRDLIVYAPQFHREIEEPIAGAIPVDAAVPIVLTEGNYLLLDEPPWSELAGLIDEVWYCAPAEQKRLEWLIGRHESYGRSPDAARAWALGTDQLNADIVERTKDRADVIVEIANGERE